MEYKKLIFLFLMLFILSTTLEIFAQAKIVISPLQEQYNLGDEINQNIKVITVENFKGFIRATLNCDQQETLLFYSPASLEANKEKVFSFSFQAKNPGKCFILVVLEKDSKIEESKSSTFIITDKINIQLTLNKQYFLPEETLKITGTAIMSNGKPFNGAASILVENQTFPIVVSKGSFSQDILLSKTIAPGKQPATVTLNDDKNNIGSTSINFEVGIVKSLLEIEVNKEIIYPSEILLIKSSLLDQAGNILPENISLKLMRLENLAIGFQKRIFLIEKVVNSGSETEYKFPQDASPQDYLIEIESSGFTTKKIISVPKVEKISYDLIDSDFGPALSIKNIGNAKYQKPFELDLVLEDISIKKIINLDLDVNEEQVYILNKINDARPEGLYELFIKSEENTKKFSNIPLTAKVSGSFDLEGVKQNIWILPLILVIILVIILIILRRDFFLNLFKSKPKREIKINKVHGFEVEHEEENKSKEISQKQTKPIIYTTKKEPIINPTSQQNLNSTTYRDTSTMKMSDLTKKHLEQKKEIDSSRDARMFSSKSETLKGIFDKYSSSLAASRIIPTTVAGQKREVSVLMTKINGLSSLENIKNSDTFLFNELAGKYISNIVKIISKNSGVAELYDSNLVVFFNVTPTANHAMLAVKTAQGIIQATNEINQELSIKGQSFQLSIAAGIHTGPIVSNNIGADKTLKYSPLSGTTSIAKALEKKAFKNEIVISESVFKNLNNVINTKKITPVTTEIGAMNSYLVKAPEEVKKDVPYWIK